MRWKVQRNRFITRNNGFLISGINYFLIFLSLLLVIPNFITDTCSADSNIYYVSINGNNANNGLTPETAWQTIEYAISMVSSGDIINIMAGIYTPSNGQIIIANYNTPGQWLTIKNYNNDSVIIDGTNCPTSVHINATIELRNCQYVRMTGLTVNHSAKGGITLMTSTCSFITIDNCTISNSSSFAFKVVNGADNIIFEYNNVYNNFNNWSNTLMSQETISFENVDTFSINNNTIKENHAECIDLKGGCRHGVVCYNEINNSGGYLLKGGQVYWGGPAIMIDARGISYDISIYNNNIYGNQSGISLNTEGNGHYEYIYIYNNIVNISILGGGSSLSGRTPILLSNTGYSTDLFHHVYIYSNTIRTEVGNSFSVFQVGHGSFEYLNSVNLQDVYIVNNIFTTAATSPTNMLAIHFISLEDGVIILNNNSYYRATGTLRVLWDGIYYTTSTPDKWGNEPLFTNPLFVNVAMGNFHLNLASPCIDAGSSSLVPSFDFDHVNRPQGAGYDIGAFEYPSGFDSTPPQISTLLKVTSTPLDTNQVFGWINISCTVTDNIAVSQVNLRIHNPSGSWNNVSMTTQTAGKYYYRTTTAFSSTGNYSYTVWARDTSNNAAISNNVLFCMPPNWDINNDGYITILDLVLISNQYGSTGGYGWNREDVDNNGIINILDMSLVSNHFNENWFT